MFFSKPMTTHVVSFNKVFAFFLSFVFIFQQIDLAPALAEIAPLALSSLFIPRPPDAFRPVHLRFFSYDLINNDFSIILDKGDNVSITDSQLQASSKDLVTYFLIGLSLPDDSFWVNLRPDAEDTITDPYLAQTDVARIMLEADLQLKKDTAQFTSPATPQGRQYWELLYRKADELFGFQEDIEIPALVRPWIVPGEVIIRETKDSAYIYKAALNVMLEQDYLKDASAYNFSDPRMKALNEYSAQLIKQLILPKITKTVNTSKRYAALRQVYYSLIVARWFKSRFQGKPGVFPALINTCNLTNLTSTTPWSKATYFKAYKKSFTQGEYTIQEPAYTPNGQVIRTYISGGVNWAGLNPGTMGGFTVGAASSAVINTPQGTALRGHAAANVNDLNLSRAASPALGTEDAQMTRIVSVRSVEMGWTPFGAGLSEDEQTGVMHALRDALHFDNLTRMLDDILFSGPQHEWDLKIFLRGEPVYWAFTLVQGNATDNAIFYGTKDNVIARPNVTAMIRNVASSPVNPVDDVLLNNIGRALLLTDLMKETGLPQRILAKILSFYMYDGFGGDKLRLQIDSQRGLIQIEAGEITPRELREQGITTAEGVESLRRSMEQQINDITVPDPNATSPDIVAVATFNVAEGSGNVYQMPGWGDGMLIMAPLEDLSLADRMNLDTILGTQTQDPILGSQEGQFMIFGNASGPKLLAKVTTPGRTSRDEAIIGALKQKLQSYPGVTIGEGRTPAGRYYTMNIEYLELGGADDDEVDAIQNAIIEHHDGPINFAPLKLPGGLDNTIYHFGKTRQFMFITFLRGAAAAESYEEGSTGSSPAAVTDNAVFPGGIDLRSIPMLVQPLGNFRSLTFTPPAHRDLAGRDLDAEFNQIQAALENNVLPESRKVKEFIYACCYRDELSGRRDNIMSCLREIFRMEEEACCASSSDLKESLMLVEAAAGLRQMSLIAPDTGE